MNDSKLREVLWVDHENLIKKKNYLQGLNLIRSVSEEERRKNEKEIKRLEKEIKRVENEIINLN